MKAKELAKRLDEHSDFEVKFCWFDDENGDCLTFDDISVCDVGFSDKVVILSVEKRISSYDTI